MRYEWMDSYLLSIGMSDMAWIGTAAEFLPVQTRAYSVNGLLTTAYSGTGSLVGIPEYVMIHDDPFWYTTLLEGAADGAFAGNEITAAYFRGTLWSGVGAGVLEGCSGLKDIWFNGSVVDELAYGNYSEQAFAGVPADVTVHLPESLTDTQRTEVEAALLACGLPDTAVFETYSLR